VKNVLVNNPRFIVQEWNEILSTSPGGDYLLHLRCFVPEDLFLCWLPCALYCLPS
jgi:hypothetical protein